MLALSAVVCAGAGDLIGIYEYEAEHSGVRIYADVRDGQKGLTAEFVGTEDLHYYATEESAPAPGLNLKVFAKAEGILFGPTVLPNHKTIRDPALEKEIQVYAGNFKVFVPALSGFDQNTAGQVEVNLSGIACTSQLCLMPFRKTLTVTLAPNPAGSGGLPKVAGVSESQPSTAPREEPAETISAPAGEHSLAQTLAGWKETVSGESSAARGRAFYFVLAVLAGLSINIMPCVLPILPLIIMRLISQAKESGPRRIALGLSFCGGIVLFFAAFALLSAAITLSTGAVIDLNSLYRQPTAVIVLFLLIVLFALVFLDVLTIALPSSVTGKQQGGGSGFAGSVGMGFFAGLLSTPCSGALLGAVLVWAQPQPLYVSSVAIALMGVGMALPYALLVSAPKLLDFVPRPGTWMEIFKKTGGFLLLIIAVKFTLTALTKDRLINVLVYGVIFAFCVWMWGQWVQFNTPAWRKWAVRLAALAIAVLGGLWLLPAAEPPIIAWQEYDPALIENALRAGRPVVVKFTADWCANCKVVERKVYQQPEAAKLIAEKNILPVRADTTQAQYPASIDLKAVFGEAGNLPVTVLLSPKDKTLTKIRGIFEPEQFRQAASELR
jgi:thiol:disulfide interchange protein DsbD